MRDMCPSSALLKLIKEHKNWGEKKVLQGTGGSKIVHVTKHEAVLINRTNNQKMPHSSQADLLIPLKVARLQLVHFPKTLRPMVASSATDRWFFLSILSADLMGHITEHSLQFQQEFGGGNHWDVLYCLRPPFSSCVYTFQNPRPTGLLKMQKVQGERMFNAWSCQPRSSELIPDQDWGGWRWGVSKPQSWHMKAVSGNDRFQELQILWENSVFRGGPGLFTVYSCPR